MIKYADVARLKGAVAGAGIGGLATYALAKLLRADNAWAYGLAGAGVGGAIGYAAAGAGKPSAVEDTPNNPIIGGVSGKYPDINWSTTDDSNPADSPSAGGNDTNEPQTSLKDYAEQLWKQLPSRGESGLPNGLGRNNEIVQAKQIKTLTDYTFGHNDEEYAEYHKLLRDNGYPKYNKEEAKRRIDKAIEILGASGLRSYMRKNSEGDTLIKVPATFFRTLIYGGDRRRALQEDAEALDHRWRNLLRYAKTKDDVEAVMYARSKGWRPPASFPHLGDGRNLVDTYNMDNGTIAGVLTHKPVWSSASPPRGGAILGPATGLPEALDGVAEEFMHLVAPSIGGYHKPHRPNEVCRDGDADSEDHDVNTHEIIRQALAVKAWAARTGRPRPKDVETYLRYCGDIMREARREGMTGTINPTEIIKLYRSLHGRERETMKKTLQESLDMAAVRSRHRRLA